MRVGAHPGTRPPFALIVVMGPGAGLGAVVVGAILVFEYVPRR